MKIIILAALFLISNGCDPVIKEVPIDNSETQEESGTNDDSNPGIPIQESMSPGEVTLKIQVKQIFDSAKDICGISKANVMKMAVQEVLARGSSLVNLPTKNEEILVNFMLAPSDLSTDTYIEAKAKESLCRDASKTYFTIISFKIVE